MRACETLARIFDGKMEFLRATIVTLQYRMGLQEDLRLIVMRDLNERPTNDIEKNCEYRKGVSAEHFHGGQYNRSECQKQISSMFLNSDLTSSRRSRDQDAKSF